MMIRTHELAIRRARQASAAELLHDARDRLPAAWKDRRAGCRRDCFWLFEFRKTLGQLRVGILVVVVARACKRGSLRTRPTSSGSDRADFGHGLRRLAGHGAESCRRSWECARSRRWRSVRRAHCDCARSYIAGITLRLARSPEAPNKTTVHGQRRRHRWTRNDRFRPAMHPSSGNTAQNWMPKQLKNYTSTPRDFQVGTQLVRILMVNHVHAQAARAFQIQGRSSMNTHCSGGPLGDFQSDAEDGFFGFAGVHVTGAEKNDEIFCAD